MQLLSGATEAGASAEHCAKQLIETVPLVMQFMRRQMRRSTQHDLTVPQLRTLYFVTTYDQPSLSCAADFIGLSLPAMSRLVDGLVRKEMISRNACPNDRRHVRLCITPSGKAALEVAWKGTHERLTREMERASDEQRSAVSQVMDLLRSMFDPETIKD